MKVIYEREYFGWEDLQDFDRDMSEAIEDADLPNDFEGAIKVTITYEEKKNEEK